VGGERAQVAKTMTVARGDIEINLINEDVFLTKTNEEVQQQIEDGGVGYK
jgi:hypothetical protein